MILLQFLMQSEQNSFKTRLPSASSTHQETTPVTSFLKEVKKIMRIDGTARSHEMQLDLINDEKLVT